LRVIAQLFGEIAGIFMGIELEQGG
jgi:hypothetical protein